jgi:hypothetical protein
MMRNNLIFIFLQIFSSAIISCGQSSKTQTAITIGENELGLVFSKNKRIVLESGEHEIDKESKVILFNILDSLILEDFDILTSNVKSLYCQIQVKYLLTPSHIVNIADLLKYPHSIESYKKLLLAQEIKSEVRDITGKYESSDLKNDEYKDSAQIDDKISKRLSDYVNISALEIRIYEQ